MKDDVYDACCWGSHIPALLACLADTVGPVLEIGMGHFSTPALHAYCVQANRKLVSVEKDPKWLETFRHLEHTNHGFVNSIDKVLTWTTWSVVFIDDSPGGENRLNHFQRFIGKAHYVVVHDYHLDNEQAIAPVIDGLNSHITKSYQPPTLIASQHRTIPQSIICL